MTTSYDLRVLEVVQETADAHSVSFAVPDGAEAAFAYRAGQFLTFAVPSDQTGQVTRSYSLSSSPHDGGPLTVTIKRTATGYASNWLCDNLRAGATLRALPPSGTFTPADLDADLLLLAGGSGITPIMSIVRTAMTHSSGQVVVFYANRDERSVIFASELAALAAEHPDRLLVVHWLESVQGLPTQAQVEAFARPFPTYDAFVCGPAPFMRLADRALRELGFPRERRHQEDFVSLSGNPFAAPKEADLPEGPMQEAKVRLDVNIDGETHTYDDWAPTITLLEQLERNGVAAPYSCREGDCSTCAVRLLEGEVKMQRNEVLDDDDLADGIRLACQSLPVTDVVRVVYD